MKQAIAVVVGVLAVVGGVVFGISRVADVSPLDPTTTTTTIPPAQEWDRDANGAFGGTDLTQNIIEMVKGAREWTEGKRPTEQFTAELDKRHNQFLDIKDRLNRLRDYPFDPRVKPLYLEVVNVYRAMLTTPPGDMRTQLDLLARRLRALGDRVFDRGRELVKPKLGEKPNPDVDIRLPEEVPNWVADGLAPGPPLDDPPPAASEEPQLRQPTRPDGPRSEWLSALSALGLPPPSVEGDAAALRDRARALVAAVERLRTTPDPEDDREEGARIRLSLLVDADAARAAQAGLVDIARRLLVVGDRLWSGPGLPARSSGLDPAILRQG